MIISGIVMDLKKKVIAVAIVVIFTTGGLLVWYKSSRDPRETAENLTVEDLLGSESVRAAYASSLIVSDESVYLPLVATPVACSYDKQNEQNFHPMLIEDRGGKRIPVFFDLYEDDVAGIGSVDTNIELIRSFDGASDTDISLAMAGTYWKETETVVILQPSNQTFDLALDATLLASYANIPVIVTEEWSADIRTVLSELGVENSMVVGDLEGYGTSINFHSSEDMRNFTLDFMMKKFGAVEYITVANSRDAFAEGYGIPKLSTMAPFLSSIHRGITLSVDYEVLPDRIFNNIGNNDEGLRNLEIINNISHSTDGELQALLDGMEKRGLLKDYLADSPYLAMLGDCYSVPYHYLFDSSGRQIVTDDLYASIDDDLYGVELASGRPIGLSCETTSLLISRSYVYDDIASKVTADSTVSEVKRDQWCENAYVAKGDDWNGAIWLMTKNAHEEALYLRREGYNIYMTKRHETGKTVSQDLLKFYTSSSMIYIFAHGSPSGYQIIDGVSYSDVRNWNMGPSVLILTSCSAGRIDVGDITTTISLNFIDSGVNSYFGGMRTEYTGSSPFLGMDIMESMVSEDLTIGLANRNAKNLFMETYAETEYYHSGIRQVYGDPAFDPYEP